MVVEQVIIIGAGIVGIAAAAQLAATGLKPLVIDRTGICEETSSGNAAALAFSDILPLAQKGVMAQVPRWLADPLGPLSIAPAYLPAMLPWLFRFWRASRPAQREAAIAAQAALMRLAETAWADLMSVSDTRHMLREDGSLELYESEAEFRASLDGWALRERHGIDFEHVRGKRLVELQPGLSDRFVAATFVPGWKTVADPKTLGQAVWTHAQARGARFARGELTGLRFDGATFELALAEGPPLRAKSIVVAAGAWSHRIAAWMGEAIPLETERGYNTTLPLGAFDIRRQLIFSRHGFVVTPLEQGVRIGGAVEFAGLDRPPNMARAGAMLTKAERFMPGLKTGGGRQWMGYRPSLPDTLPVIGRSRATSRMVYAFGHGHLGLTQSAATGLLVRDLITGRTPEIDISPFSARRFS